MKQKKISQKFITDVSSLSEPDLKIVYQGVYEFTDLYGNGKYTCANEEIKRVISDLKYYVSDLKRLKEKYYKSESTTQTNFFIVSIKKVFFL